MSGPASYDTTWKCDGNGKWQRNLVGLEHAFTFLSAGAQSNEAALASMPSLKIFSSALTRMSSSQVADKAKLSVTMRNAMKATMYQVPNLTFKAVSVGVPGGMPKFQIHYEQQIIDSEVESWPGNSLEESVYPVTPVLDLRKALAEVQARLTPKQPFLLHAVYFQNGDSVSHIGLVAIMDHGFFDAVGTFNFFDKLLHNVVQNTQRPLFKADPEISKWECTPLEVRSADHTADIMARNAVLSKTATHQVKPDVADLTGTFLMHCARYTFTEEETAVLLKTAKKHNITITLLAFACLYLPILKLFPATDDEEVGYALSLNARPVFPDLSPSYYNNCAGSCHGHFPTSILSSNAREGICQTQADADSILRLAKHLRTGMNEVRDDLLRVTTGWDIEMEKIMRGELPMVARPNIIIYVADGLMDRYVSRQYVGDDLSLDVEDITLYTNESSSFLYPRTATFAGRLTLQYAFNESAWKSADVHRMAEDWASALKYVLLSSETI